MPEGNVIHYHARRLRRAFRRSAVRLDSPQGRFSEGAALLNGLTLHAADAYGKHLLLDFGDLRWLHIHLGLFGTWRIGTGAPPAPTGQIRLRLRNDTHFAELRGPTTCEVLDIAQRDALLARIGPDPIRTDADPLLAWARVERSRQPIATLLMDQRIFAGVGNIYRAEVLFRQNISPFRAGVDVGWSDFHALWVDLVDLMSRGTSRGRIMTVRPADLPTIRGAVAPAASRGIAGAGRRGRYDTRAYVYRRDGRACFLCDTSIEVTTLQARRLYWCPACQAS